jgi:hypothetical protein
MCTNSNCLHRFLLCHEYDPSNLHLDVHHAYFGCFYTIQNRSNFQMGASTLNMNDMLYPNMYQNNPCSKQGGLCILETFLFTLIPEGLSPFFSKNTPNLPFLAQEAQIKLFSLFCTFNCGILH